MPESINLRPRDPQSQLVLPYLPMPAASAKSTASNMPNPAAPMPIHQHPRYAKLLTMINQRLISPNPPLKEIFHSLLREFDRMGYLLDSGDPNL